MDLAFSDILGNPIRMATEGDVSSTSMIFEFSSELSLSAFGFFMKINTVLKDIKYHKLTRDFKPSSSLIYGIQYASQTEDCR